MKKEYEDVLRIRVFEELVLELFSKNKVSGTTHTYVGEEATAVAVMHYVKEQDKVFSNHRCHGHYLAYGGKAERLLAEMMSKESGLCQGRGGSQHIHYKNFYTNGVQGGIVPNAVGVAFSEKLAGTKANTVVFLGDGTLGQGVVYESFNMASIYEIPIVFIVENNQYAMSTRVEDAFAGDIKTRVSGFDIKSFEISSTDVDELLLFFEEVFSYLDRERKPVCAIVNNYRLGAHSKGDDTRDQAEINSHKKHDPVRIVEEKVGKEETETFQIEYKTQLERSIETIENETCITIEPERDETEVVEYDSFLSRDDTRFVERMREAFFEQLAANRQTVFLGEDIRDPYGGAFKATKGLSAEFGERVLNMPISEACMAGISVGMAINHMLPVAEMMFGDFVTLAFDQLLNHAAKYHWVYGQDVTVPMVLRVPSGAKRGYGPTHSQSLEKYMAGIPGIKMIALNIALDPKRMYQELFRRIDQPVVVVENKKMYGERNWVIDGNQYQEFSVSEINRYGFPSLVFSLDPGNKPDAYAITYGGMLEEVCEAAIELLMKEEIQIDVIALSQLAPLPILDIKDAIREDLPIYVIEEGTKTMGIGAEIIASCIEYKTGSHYFRIATPDVPIPNGIALEKQVIPDKERIADRIRNDFCCR